MHISKVELENIKSHAESTFEFTRGSTAISGENGAGKTTIIEAIAWTLFDVLDYKKDDFVRRGAKKGSARVTFESGLDEREYVVYRDTGTGYYVFDPQLKMRIADKKEEVTRFLWQHLGVEPGTDLESLFKHAIGVPQGTLTAIFIATAAERKKTFDTLLKVEEYRRGAEELLRTQRFVENQISAVQVKIARSEGELSRIDEVESDHHSAKGEAENYSTEHKRLEKAVAAKQAVLADLDKRESEIAKARSELDSKSSELERVKIELKQKSAELEVSKDAAARIESVRANAERHTTVLAGIGELERERTERDRLRSEMQKVENAEAAVKAEERHVRAQLAEVQEAHQEIVKIKPLLDQQIQIEKERDEVRKRSAELQAIARQAATLDTKLEALRDSFSKNKQALTEAIERSAAAAGVQDLQTRENGLIAELARLRATLERDEKFQSEIRNGLCPILSARCLNLKEGETLEAYISGQFEDTRVQISLLEQERSSISVELRSSRDAESFVARVAALEERRREIEAEGKRLRAERDEIEKAAEQAAASDAELKALEAKLAVLDDPRSRQSALERQIASEMVIRDKLSDIESNMERLESDRRLLVEQLDDYKDLDERWNEATAVRDATIEAHRTFIALEAAAGLLASREEAFSAIQREFVDSEKKVSIAEAKFATASAGYDRDRHVVERDDLASLNRSMAETGVRVENAAKRSEQLAAELERLAKIREALAKEFKERERLGGVLEATVFIRDTLKEAAPLVARNYVYHVSAEANQMFREISGNAERSLKWTEDYGIQLEEGGYERPFQSLSGGEQMAAALSVRLALLKQLSDIRIAFFDEPTTNMDAERRENLAMQIGQIKHFDQLFVISHDDTFEGYMDHEVRIGQGEMFRPF